MRVAVLGTGTVGRTLAAALDTAGHAVALGTRDPQATLARGDPLPLRPVALADAATGADVVVNATNGAGSLAALEAVGEDALDGTVLVDVANPLAFADGQLSLFVANTDSLAERIQRRFPRARVVKTLNTVTAAVMVDPGQLGGGDHTIFVCGDDADAKRVTAELLRGLGWSDVLDLGGLAAARGMEMYLPLWLSAMQALGTPLFNVKVVRDGR